MKKVVKSYFENMGQVLFIDNAYFGLAFLIIAAFFSPRLVLAGTGASLIGFAIAQTGRTPLVLRAGGLITINGFFFGIAMASLFQESAQYYALLLIGAVAVPYITKAAYEVLQHWKLSPFIISYILVVWMFCLSANAFSLRFEPVHSGWGAQWPTLLGSMPDSSLFLTAVTSIFSSIGEIFFLPNPFFGLALAVLVSAFSPRKGFYFLAGTAVATAAALLFAKDTWTFAEIGKYTFSAGLISLGLSAFPEKIRWQTILMFCLFSFFLTLASTRFFENLGLPILTLPYVLTLWTALLSRAPRLNLSWAE